MVKSRYQSKTGALASFLYLMSMTGVAAEAAGTESPPTGDDINVTCIKKICSLDAAVSEALSRKSRLLLGNGEYSLSQPLTGSIVIQAKDWDSQSLESGYLQTNECNEAMATTSLPVISQVTVRPAGNGQMQVSAQATDTVVFKGVNLRSAGPDALRIDSGYVKMFDSSVIGNISISNGAQAYFEDVYVTARYPEGVNFSGTESSDISILPTSACQNSLISVTDGASFRGYNVELDEGYWSGLCVMAATANVCKGFIHDTTGGFLDGYFGYGAEALTGGQLTVESTRFENNKHVGVLASGTYSTLTLTGSTQVTNTLRGRISSFAIGVMAQESAVVQASNIEVRGTQGPGLYVASDAQASFDRALITENAFAGVVALDGRTTLTNSSITDTQADAEWGGGFGIFSNNLFGVGSLTLTDSTIGAHPYSAVWLDGNGSYTLERNALSGSTGVLSQGWPIHGNAVFAENGVTAWDGKFGLRLNGNSITDASNVAVFLHGASATLDGTNTWAGNTLDVKQQYCGNITPLSSNDLAGVPTSEICPASDELIDYSIQFTSLYLAERSQQP